MISRLYTSDPDNLSLKRKRQIDTLKIFNANVTEILLDSEYRVEFTSGGYQMALLVSLGPDFPHEKPLLRITPNISHPWVNEKSEVVRAPGLINYAGLMHCARQKYVDSIMELLVNMEEKKLSESSPQQLVFITKLEDVLEKFLSFIHMLYNTHGVTIFTVHSDLGRVVQAIIREFEKNPPPLASESAPKPPNRVLDATPVMPDPVFGATHFIPTTSGVPTPASSESSPSGLSELLAGMTVAELQRIHDNNDRLDELVENLPPLQRLLNTRAELVATNITLAKSNLTLQPHLEELRAAVIQQLEKISSLRERYEVLSQEHQRLSDRYAPDNIREALKLLAIKSDEESEQIAENFLNGSTDVDQFVAEYIRMRTVSQLRKTKEEKLYNQLNELKRAGF